MMLKVGFYDFTCSAWAGAHVMMAFGNLAPGSGNITAAVRRISWKKLKGQIRKIGLVLCLLHTHPA